MSHKDPQLKAERGYTDKRSYVRVDGSEVLYGKDWTQRKREVWERGGGRCERMVGWDYRCRVRCRSEMHEPHHINPRWPKRDDRAFNLIGLCRLHHSLLDRRKPRWTRAEAEHALAKE